MARVPYRDSLKRKQMSVFDTRESPKAHPPAGSREEARRFQELQETFPEMYRRIFSDPRAERTVVVVPSMSLDEDELRKIEGVIHYEERMLCLLMLLQLPRTRLVYVTSIPIGPDVIDYYLHLLPGVPAAHARERLSLVTVGDESLRPLSAKLLDRPEMMSEVASLIRDPESTHLTCFNTTHLERTLAVRWGIPVYGADPALTPLGNKSNSRSIMRQSGLELPEGYEDLRDRSDIIEAIVALHTSQPDLQRAVVKLNEGFSGEGNATLDIGKLKDAVSLEKEADRLLTEELRFEAADETWDTFESKFAAMGGVVEALIEGANKTSPSVQMRIDPLGGLHVVSTHDQALGGPTGQVFLGCSFPARPEYRLDLHEAGLAVAKTLKSRGVLGRFGVDFVSVPEGDRWRHYAIEVNLRKGGTTLPYLMLEFLTGGTYDSELGEFRTSAGAVRTYFASDNVVSESFRGSTPAQLIDAAIYERIQYRASSQKGVVFHLLGAVTDYGKLGLVSIALSDVAASAQYDDAVRRLKGSPALHQTS